MSLFVCLLAGLQGPPAGDLDATLEAATKAALTKIAPCVVQVRTVGGSEFIGKRETVQRGTGPTTGMIVSADGYIISSSFNFANKPAAITVVIPGRKEPLAAKVIAEDQTRMLTLLKVEATALPVPQSTAKSQLKIGQWAVAIGRTWSDAQNTSPSASVGILSAFDRVWGKAIQTDAKVSPVNYGGPLIDLEGRVIGILVPLAPRGDNETAGVEWYDSGIGFAIPMDDVQHVLPKLKEGKTLRKGRIGITMKNEEPVMAEATVTNVALDSPASKLGIEPGDKIIAVDGKPIKNQAQFLHAMGPKYEGDAVSLKLKRKDKEVDIPKVVLAGPPTSHSHTFLGILPMRDDNENGVAVRYVFPNTPAATAGIEAGDRITRIENVPLSDRDSLQAILNSMFPGMKVKVEVKKKSETKKLDLTLIAMNDFLPAGEIPTGTAKKALAERKPLPGRPPVPGETPMPGQPPTKRAPAKTPEKAPVKAEAKPKTGFFEEQDTTSGRAAAYYVPETYDPNVSHGIVVWLHPAGEALTTDFVDLWKKVCNENQLIFYAPKAENPQGWLTSEADVIQLGIRALMRQYTIDRQRIVLHGRGNGAQLALYLGFDARDLIRGVATVSGTLAQPPKENVANQRLSFFLVGGDKDPQIDAVRSVPAKLKEQHFPIFYFEIAGQGNGYISDLSIFEQMIQWIVGLDRL